MRFQVLDGWRGVCALSVALFHLNALGHFHDVGFVRGSYLFVDFFFVLSGFVITHAYLGRIGDAPSAGGFLVRRFGRVWPLHAMVLLAFVPLEVLKALVGGSSEPAFSGQFEPSAFFTNMALLHALGVEKSWTWNIPSWSISAEFFAYVTFAAVCLATRRATARGQTAALTAVSALLAVVGAAVVIGFSDQYIDTSYDYGYFRCLYGFFTGHLVYRLHAASRITASSGGVAPGRPAAGLLAGMEILCLVAVIAFVAASAGNALSLAAPLVFALVVWVFTFEAGPLSRLLATTPFQRLGTWSYSVYMVHALVLAVLQKGASVMQGMLGRPLFTERTVDGTTDRLLFFGDLWAMDLLAVVYLLVVTVLSAITYRFIELPGQAFFNRLLVRMRKPSASMPVQAVPSAAEPEVKTA
ncbi:acyltransferase family protein [Azospirillum picis]|uniref:Peptidoglycan/LPS O-acetylase OafA/YrhL n=1 Tax=Azospirillum picis TaxID=488438 RepID=A0ABU0MSJ4_9PROT|nr:acyltransferase [Azospirillum picis]MBP2300829.1 peptidoglycan/LPS O-acetylase OafA/YrhL [Azospirillum picis]MDQ0536086.1 peptidoglycan/LPS O-acetylase OafA/YrhL [Azospirillum picis]